MSHIKKPENIGLISLISSVRVQEYLTAADLSFVSIRGTQEGCRVYSYGSTHDTKEAVKRIQGEFGELYSPEGYTPAERIVFLLDDRNMRLGVAESCTGGLAGALITQVPGSSNVFWGGFLTYSNESKESLLNVENSTIAKYGAVSAETVEEMAQGVLSYGGADTAVAISGIAGPGGGSDEKPVGTVWFGIAMKDGLVCTIQRLFHGSRDDIRQKAAEGALLLLELVLRKGNLDTNFNWQYT